MTRGKGGTIGLGVVPGPVLADCGPSYLTGHVG